MRDGNRLGCGWRASRWPRRRWWAWTRVVPTAARVRDGGQRSDGVGVVRTCMSPTVVTAHPSTATSTRWARRAARRSRWWRWTCGLRQVPRGAAPKRGGRPSPAVGEPGVAATRRRPVGKDAVPVADAPREHDPAATPGFHAASDEHAAGGAGVGHQGAGHAAVELPVSALAERMWRRWYGWAIRSRLEPIKRVARMIRAVPQRHLLPSGRARPLPGRVPSLLPSAIQDSRRNASMALLLPEAFAPIRKVSGASFSVASR